MDRILYDGNLFGVITENGTMVKDVTNGTTLCGDYIINSTDLSNVFNKCINSNVIQGEGYSSRYRGYTIRFYDYHKLLKDVCDKLEESSSIISELEENARNLKEDNRKLQEENKELRECSLIKRILRLFIKTKHC